MNDERAKCEDERRAIRARRTFWSMAALLVLCPLLLVGFGLALQKRPDGTKLLAAGQKPTPAPLLPAPMLVALDKAVQQRFATLPVDGGFGIRRVISIEPVTQGEKNALVALEKSPLQVVFYTAGRALAMNRKDGMFVPTGSRYISTRGPVKLGLNTRVVQGGHGLYTVGQSLPLTSHLASPSDAPSAREIRQHLTGTLENVRVEGQRWKSGRWEIAVVPVPASSPSCINCHNMRLQPRGTKTDFPNLKLGDTIGYAIYAYAPKDKTKTEP